MTQERLSLTYARAMSREVIQQLELVGAVPHRGESGRARESYIREFLRKLVAPGIGIDTGFVIDGVGGVSKQVDVIIYRTDYHPVLTIGDVKHFLVESVMAMFEIKARLTSEASVIDAFDNIDSVKALDRTGGGSNYTLPTATGERKLVDQSIYQCQIFGGVITEATPAPETVLRVTGDYIAKRPRHRWPNIYVALRHFALRYKEPNGEVTEDPNIAERLALSDPNVDDGESPLVDLAIALTNILRVSVRSDFSPSNYFKDTRESLHELALQDEKYPDRAVLDERLPPGSLSRPREESSQADEA